MELRNLSDVNTKETSCLQELVPVCGLCKQPLGKNSTGKKCYFCGAKFTNPEVLKH